MGSALRPQAPRRDAPARHPRRQLRSRLLRLYQALWSAFGPQGWWPGRTAFEVVVGAILTQNTAWANVERAIGNLRAAGALSPETLRDLPLPELARLVRPSGYFNIKARRLQAFIEHLWRHRGGDLRQMLRQPAARLRAELLAIPGIGPETADSILLYAANRPLFVVDAYTRRILARHRLVSPRIDYEALRALFEEYLPHDPRLFNEYHALLVRVGKEFCRARPRCEACPLRFDLRGRPPRRPP